MNWRVVKKTWEIIFSIFMLVGGKTGNEYTTYLATTDLCYELRLETALWDGIVMFKCGNDKRYHSDKLWLIVRTSHKNATTKKRELKAAVFCLFYFLNELHMIHFPFIYGVDYSGLDVFFSLNFLLLFKFKILI